MIWEEGARILVTVIRKRLQVFVSSTYSDLVEERQAAVEAILTAGHIPAGMELFTSCDQSQTEVINQWIDESDVYLLILGGRYGSIEPSSGKSYIHIEYEYAVSKGKALFACVISDYALDKRFRTKGRSVIETDNPLKLKEFRTVVLSKLVRFWEDSKDVKIAIGETLSQFSRRDELSGWIRPHENKNLFSIADEITRLQRKNAAIEDSLPSAPREALFARRLNKIKVELEEIERGELSLTVEELGEYAEERLRDVASSGIPGKYWATHIVDSDERCNIWASDQSQVPLAGIIR